MKYIAKIIASLSVVAAIVACNYLDKQPDDMLTMDQAFKNKENTEQYLANIFSYLPNDMEAWQNLFFGASDEGNLNLSYHISTRVKTGNYSALEPAYDVFVAYYRAIRSCNVFISRVDECEEISENVRTLYKAEAKFLRTFYHFMLFRMHGPVFYVDTAYPVDTPIEKLQMPRNSVDEYVNYLVQDLDDEVIPILPEVITDNLWIGKPTKGAAMALKSRILLYAASPLYNGNTDYKDMINRDGKQLIPQQERPEKWQKAARAALDVIETDRYSLYKENDSGGNHDPYASYQNVFLTRWNSEVIFARPDCDMWEFDRFATPRQIGGATLLNPTQEQVDAYFMEDGKTITTSPLYSESGFSGSPGKYTTANTFNMYCKREPRFYASIAYNGSMWKDGLGERPVQLHYSGLDGKEGSHDFSATGYLLKKLVSPSVEIKNGRKDPRPWIYFRLAEIYLNYAEAQNEWEYSNSTEYPAPLYFVNLIRERAGIPVYGTDVDDIPIPSTQKSMQAAIRAERRVELAFENHRFFDTRRWKIAEETDRGDFWGMDTNADGSSFYVRTKYETRVFDKKHYLQPITQYETDRNPNCVQNTGW